MSNYENIDSLSKKQVREWYFSDKETHALVKKFIENDSSAIVFDGRKWKVGAEEIKIEGKINFLLRLTSSIKHSLKSKFSKNYCVSYKAAIEQVLSALQKHKDELVKNDAIAKLTKEMSPILQTIADQKNNIAILTLNLSVENQKLKDLTSFKFKKETYTAKLEAYNHRNIALKMVGLITDKTAEELKDLETELKHLALLHNVATEHVDEKLTLVQTNIKLIEGLIASENLSLAANEKALTLKQNEMKKLKGEAVEEKSEAEEASSSQTEEVSSEVEDAPVVKFKNTQAVLVELNKKIDPAFHKLFEALFNRFNEAYKTDIVASHILSGNKMSITFNQSLRIWLDSRTDKNDVEPVGGVIFDIGDQNHQLTFTFDAKNLNFETGFNLFAKTPGWAAFLMRYIIRDKDPDWAKPAMQNMKLGADTKIQSRCVYMGHDKERTKAGVRMVKEWSKGEVLDDKADNTEYKYYKSVILAKLK